MRRTIIIFTALMSAFFAVWGYKAENPINRAGNVSEGETLWYESTVSSHEVNEEWVLDPEIPDNYIPVPGEDEMYMVTDDNGMIIGYRQRIKQVDDSWEWEDVEDPDLDFGIIPVEEAENLFEMIDEEDVISYQKYIRNADNSYAFVETDEEGTELDIGTNADTVSELYEQYSDNLYSLYNENGVFIGYRERVLEEDGHYYWEEADTESCVPGIVSLKERMSELTGDQDGSSLFGDGEDLIQTEDDGSYTVTKKTTNTVTENGYSVMYETTIYYTYDSDGNLLKTRKEGPAEVSRESLGTSSETPDKSLIASDLDSEFKRVSEEVSFNTEKAEEVLELLNKERVSQGKTALSMSMNSESYKSACIKAADMSIYGYCATESPMYGTLEEMLDLFGCSSENPSENIWRAGTKTAQEIHDRFQSNENSRTIRMSDYTEAGIAVVDTDNCTYIAEIFLK